MVDLPEPEGPTTKTNSPFSTSIETSSSATTPFLYAFETSWRLIIVVGEVQAGRPGSPYQRGPSKPGGRRRYPVSMAWRRVAAACAGPLLIVAVVLLSLRGFVVGDRLTNQQPDLLSFWFPRWAFLGRTLAAGHLPLWNPFEMAGYRFAADPQSGWLYAPPSLLFWLCSPGVAIRAMIVLNPLLGGLGLYAFLRVDGFGRTASTAGGLSLAGAMATSEIAVSLPFAGAIAWTTVVLLGAAGFRAVPAMVLPARLARARRVRLVAGRERPPVARARDRHGARPRIPRGEGRGRARAARGPRARRGRRDRAVRRRPAAGLARGDRPAPRLHRRLEPRRRVRGARRRSGHRHRSGGAADRALRRLGGLAPRIERRAGCVRGRVVLLAVPRRCEPGAAGRSSWRSAWSSRARTS